MSSRTGEQANHEVTASIARAVAFLERSQLPNGELPVLTAGELDPSVFPTALAAYSLSFAPEAAAVQNRALDFLLYEMDGRGLWKHWTRAHPRRRELPPDLDDTSCASAALRRAGRAFPDNRKILLGNRHRKNGLFYTWKLTAEQFLHPLILFVFFRKTAAKPFDVDAVVNANVLFYLGARPETRPVIDHLLDILARGRETACDKWYDNPFVVWYFFARALQTSAPEAGEIMIRKLTAATPRNALEMALVACSLLCWGPRPDIRPLLESQLDSGGWPAAPLYLAGRPRRRDGSFGNEYRGTPRWGSEELTTVFCIEALARFRAAI